MLILQLTNQMDFFNKHRDLFGVNNNTPIPQARLSLNNNLFIDRPFIPTYAEANSINSKLRALKKDYNELDEHISDFERIKTPRKISSRKGKELREAREIDMNAPNINKKYDMNDPLKDKRGSWLKDEQKNLLKHSEMEHVFTHQIYDEMPKPKNIRQGNIPKAQNFMFGQQQLPPRFQQRLGHKEKPPAQNNSNSVGKLPSSRPQQQTYNNSYNNSHNNARYTAGQHKKVITRSLAQQKRDESKRNLQSRRQKLSNILKTSW